LILSRTPLRRHTELDRLIALCRQRFEGERDAPDLAFDTQGVVGNAGLSAYTNLRLSCTIVWQAVVIAADGGWWDHEPSAAGTRRETDMNRDGAIGPHSGLEEVQMHASRASNRLS